MQLDRRLVFVSVVRSWVTWGWELVREKWSDKDDRPLLFLVPVFAIYTFATAMAVAINGLMFMPAWAFGLLLAPVAPVVLMMLPSSCDLRFSSAMLGLFFAGLFVGVCQAAVSFWAALIALVLIVGLGGPVVVFVLFCKLFEGTTLGFQFPCPFP